MRNNVPVYGILIVLLIVFRILVNTSQDALLFVSIINLVALLIVFFSVVEQIKEKILLKVKQTRASAEIIHRESASIKKKANYIAYLSFAFLSLFYLFFFYCELGNDIISIIALGISLSDDHIVNVIVNIYVSHYRLGV